MVGIRCRGATCGQPRHRIVYKSTRRTTTGRWTSGSQAPIRVGATRIGGELLNGRLSKEAMVVACHAQPMAAIRGSVLSQPQVVRWPVPRWHLTSADATTWKASRASAPSGARPSTISPGDRDGLSMVSATPRPVASSAGRGQSALDRPGGDSNAKWAGGCVPLTCMIGRHQGLELRVR